MLCLGLEHGAEEWLAQMNPLSYGGIPLASFYFNIRSHLNVRSGSIPAKLINLIIDLDNGILSHTRG